MVKGSIHLPPPHLWIADWGPAGCQPTPLPALDSPPAPAPPAHLPPWLEPGGEGYVGKGRVCGSLAWQGSRPLAQRPQFHPQAGSRPLGEGAGSQESFELKLCSGSWQGEGGAAPPTWCAPRWPSAAGVQKERERGYRIGTRKMRQGERETAEENRYNKREKEW